MENEINSDRWRVCSYEVQPTNQNAIQLCGILMLMMMTVCDCLNVNGRATETRTMCTVLH
jgi:hypothetical protein